jgi:hypothetical protein
VITTDSGTRNPRVFTRRRRQDHTEPGPRDEILAPQWGRQADHHAKSLEPEFARPSVLDHAAEAERAALLGDQPVIVRIVYQLVSRPTHDRLARPLRRTNRPATAHPEA